MLKKIIVFLAMSFIIICTLMGGTYLYVKNNIYDENNLASENHSKGKEESIEDVKYEEVEGIDFYDDHIELKHRMLLEEDKKMHIQTVTKIPNEIIYDIRIQMKKEIKQKSKLLK